MNLPDLTSLTNSLGSFLPSGSQIAQNVALGAATSVVLAGLKSNAGADALDPLQLFHKDAQPLAATNNPAVAVGPTITATAFAQLPPTVQTQLTLAGVHIVAG